MTQSPFSFHTQLTFEEHGEQSVGTCPFCEREQKFYFNNQNFLWDCKNQNCKDPKTGERRSGNVVSFLRQLYQEHDTLGRAAEIIHEERGLPSGRISQLGLKFNPYNGSIIIPTFKGDKLNNLYKATKDKVKDKEGNWVEKWIIRCTPSVEHTLMNMQETTEDTILITEGHWDRIAALALIGEARGISFAGVPGAGVWKPSWTDYLADKHVIFAYDNDNAGQVGYERVILKHITGHHVKPKSISILRWPEGLKEGYDINDYYKEHGKAGVAQFLEYVEPFSAPEGTVVVSSTVDTVEADRSCDTFDKFLDRFKSLYHTTPDMVGLLKLTFACIYSIRLGGEQIWIRVAGPAGVGKTSVTKCMSGSTQVVIKSTFTGLFSGHIDGSGQDHGLIPMIKGKTLMVKDADALLRQADVSRIFSELRDFYDKDSSTGYRHGQNFDYQNVRATFILFGTNALRKADNSFLGERFLDYELSVSDDDADKIEDIMLEKSIMIAKDTSTLPPETGVMSAAKGFIEHLMQKDPSIDLDEELKKDIKKLSRFAAQMRTEVDRDFHGKGEATFTPVIEVPTRLIGQLVKMCICVAVVTGDLTDSKALLRKIVLDIINPRSNRYKICQILAEGFYTRDDLMDYTQLSKATITRELDDLRLLEFLELTKVDSKVGVPGRKSLAFKLKEELIEGLQKLNDNKYTI